MYAELAGAHRRLLTGAFSENGGKVVDTQGDSFFVAFARAGDALSAAVEGQRRLQDHPWPEGLSLRVRMGLHTGEARVVDGNYLGIDVHRAARIAGAGHGAQLLISEATHALLRDTLPLGVSLRDLREHRLKDFSRPERIFQVDIEGLQHSFPPLATSTDDVSTLHPPLSSFVGRDKERAALVSLLKESEIRLVTLTGPGGIGKTRLSLESAKGARSGFRDGMAVISLATASSAAAVVSTILQGLGVPEIPGRTPLDVLGDYVRRREFLLVLDNFEQAVSAAPIVGELLATSPQLKVLVTSREVLHLTGEREFRVPPLTTPISDDLASIAESEAAQLFAARAQAVRDDFQLDGENAPVIADICRIVDGLPLGIELAAARIRIMTPDQILERLRNSYELLTGGPRDVPQRQRALHSAIDWSYQLLDQPERRLFERLALFEDGWSLEALEELCASPDIPDVLEALSSLVDKSLVIRQEETRFSMLRSIREFALQSLEKNADTAALRDAHANYFLHFAEDAEKSLRTHGQSRRIEALRADQANLHAAIAWSFETGRSDRVVRFGWALWTYWWVGSQFEQGITWMEKALASQLSPRDEGHASVVCGVLAFGRGTMDGAATMLRRGSEWCERVNDDFGSGTALALLGVIVGLENPSASRDISSRAIERFTRIDDDWGIGFAHLCLGRVLIGSRDFEEAHDVLAEAIKGLRRVGEGASLSLALMLHGWALLGMDRLEEAFQSFVEALETVENIRTRHDAARMMEGLAAAATAIGDPARGALFFGAAEGMRRSIAAAVWVPDQRTHEETLSRLKATLGERFESLWDEGISLSVEQTLSIARELMLSVAAKP